MRLTRVEYEACFNLGNYENEKIRFVVQLDPDEMVSAVIGRLRTLAETNAQPNSDKLWSERHRLESEVKQLARQVEQARQQWITAAAFMKAQGIKANPATFPDLPDLLSPAQEESVVIGEHDDDDDESEELHL